MMKCLFPFRQFGLLVAWRILRSQFLRLSPSSREQILKNMQDGVLLLDENFRIIAANGIVQRFFGWKNDRSGEYIQQALGNYPELFVCLQNDKAYAIEIPTRAGYLWQLVANVVPLFDQKSRRLGTAIFLRDNSGRVQAEQALRASEERFRMLVENQGEGIAMINVTHCFSFANPAAEKILGVLSGELTGKSVHSILSPGLYASLAQRVHSSTDHVIRGSEIPYTRPDGKRIILEMTSSPQFQPDGTYYATFVIFRDVTGRKRAEEALVSRQRYLSLLNEITSAALEASDLQSMLQTLADRMGELLYADGCYITLWDEEHQRTIPAAAYGIMRESYTKNTRIIPNEVTMTASVLNAGHALVAEDVFNSPYISPHIAVGFPTKSMLGLPLIASGHKLGAALIGFNATHQFTEEEISLGEQAARHVALAVFKARLLEDAGRSRDEAQAANKRLRQALDELDYLATTDKLTGAYNRYKFDEIFSYEISRFDRYKNPLSLMMFDIDHFKKVNDTFGHHAGDQVLTTLGRLVRDNIRETDTLTRWGGEEFIILTPGIECDRAVIMANKIRNLIEQNEILAARQITISIGITTAFPGDTPDAIVRRADDALYMAKHNGRNRVEIVEENQIRG